MAPERWQSAPSSDWLPGAVCIAMRTTATRTLPAGEAALVDRAVPSRRAQFAAGRECAHEALRRSGRPVEQLLRLASGAPDWPEATVGSLAHCEAMAVAVVAGRERWQGLGVDVERDAPLQPDVADYVLTAHERLAGTSNALLAFSAKECVHKLIHPLRGAFLEFEEVEIEIEADRFVPRPISAAARAAFAGLRFDGRWLRADGLLYSLLAAD